MGEVIVNEANTPKGLLGQGSANIFYKESIFRTLRAMLCLSNYNSPPYPRRISSKIPPAAPPPAPVDA